MIERGAKHSHPVTSRLGGRKSGVWPLNPQRMLGEIQKPVMNNIITVPTPSISFHDTLSVQPPDILTTFNALTAEASVVL
jgi:hypothetical protein